MKIPKRIQALIDMGLIAEVEQRLMSGKEADVYVVRSNAEVRCAKVYKEASRRSFKQAARYQEGRKTRSSRRARAMEKGSRFGRKQQDETWHNAEVNALHKLARAGVRVPEPYLCVDGVLLMELITDSHGDVAPRLGDVSLSPIQALEDHAVVMQYIVRMLCVGIVHGDLSEFNILVDARGPVIIDLPQAVDAAANNNAEFMLVRDVNRISHYYGQFAPRLLKSNYAKEIWGLYEDGELHPESTLTGYFEESTEAADVDGVIEEIKSILAEEEARKQRLIELEEPS